MSYGSETVDVAMTQNELQWLCVLLEKKSHYSAKDASHSWFHCKKQNLMVGGI